MELSYIWIDKYRNFKSVGISLSGKYYYSYDVKKKSLEISRNDGYIPIYPEHITNVNAMVGANGVGKTNLIDLLALRKADRNKHNEEFEVIYKPRKSKNRFNTEVERIDNNSAYFFVYEYGESDEGELYCVEGNDIECYSEIFHNCKQVESIYWREKYWFSFICRYKEGKFEVLYDTNHKVGDYEYGEFTDSGIIITGDHRSEQDKHCIISFREKLNKRYYDYHSTKSSDESKVMIPRRVATYETYLASSKFTYMHSQLKNKNRKLFNDKEYYLKVNYDINQAYVDENLENVKLKFTSTELLLKKKDQNYMLMLESFVIMFLNNIIDHTDKSSEYIEKIKVSRIELEKLVLKSHNIKGFYQYYENMLKIICGYFINDNDDRKHVLSIFNKLVNSISKAYNEIDIMSNCIQINVGKVHNSSDIVSLLTNSVDEKTYAMHGEVFTVFGDFFSYSFDLLSDGENAMLGLYSSIFEQLKSFSGERESYILLFDEPEMRMHPELCRKFINDLIDFLDDITNNGEMYQIIISTHSPFILTDITPDRTTYLEKKGYETIIRNDIEMSTFGQNIHSLLRNNFFMQSTVGDFSSNYINSIIIELKKYDGSDEIMTSQEFDVYKSKIGIIGEEIIRIKLIQMLKEIYFKDNDSIDKELESLKKEREILNYKLKKLEERKENDTTKNT